MVVDAGLVPKAAKGAAFERHQRSAARPIYPRYDDGLKDVPALPEEESGSHFGGVLYLPFVDDLVDTPPPPNAAVGNTL